MNLRQQYLSTCLFTTVALIASASAAQAQDFAVLAGTAVTCTAGSITGDVGIANGIASAFTNTGCAFTGTARVNDQAAKDAYAAFVAKYTALAALPTNNGCPVITGTLDGVTLSPGTYCVSSEAKTGVLTLDGGPNATWLIKVPSGALTGTNFSVVLAGGAQACNVTWWVDAAATMTTSNLKGNLLAGADITFTGGTFIKGDAFAGGDGTSSVQTGAVTLTGAAVIGCETGGSTPPAPAPRACSDRLTGGGYIVVNGRKATFGITAGVRDGKPRGQLTYIDHGTGRKVKSTSVTTYEEIDATTRFIAGTAKVDGGAGSYSLIVSDKGEPGKKDTFAIRLFNAAGVLVDSATGTLSGGNIQLHNRDCGRHGRDRDDQDDRDDEHHHDHYGHGDDNVKGK